MLFRCKIEDDYFPLIQKTIEGNNIVGRVLKYRNEDDISS